MTPMLAAKLGSRSTSPPVSTIKFAVLPLATTRTTGPNRASNLSRWWGASDGEARTSKRSSTLVLDVLACWPPGPPDAVKLHSSSAQGMASDGLTCKISPGTPVKVPAAATMARALGVRLFARLRRLRESRDGGYLVVVAQFGHVIG